MMRARFVINPEVVAKAEESRRLSLVASRAVDRSSWRSEAAAAHEALAGLRRLDGRLMPRSVRFLAGHSPRISRRCLHPT